jgi:hypothetical protein
MKYPSVQWGQDNKAVRALKIGLIRWHRARGLKSTSNLKSNLFGEGTRRDVARFKRANRMLPVIGKVWGSDAWKRLLPYLDPNEKSLIRQHNRAVAAAKAELAARRLANSEAGKRARFRANALKLYAIRGHYIYTQIRPMLDTSIYDRVQYRRLDCSSTHTKLCQETKLPDPNGRGYDGQGYTGTLVQHGIVKSIGACEAADSWYYGDQGGGVPRHVVSCIGKGVGLSHGSTPMKLVGPYYRGDITHGRDHLT